MPVSLLTCVTNAGGMGPGHSCIEVNGTVFSFQNPDYGEDNSGWLQFSRTDYLRRNRHRPVITQVLNSQVSDGLTLRYINASITDDDDYLSSGVCSSQAANAIGAGSGERFNTPGIDTPYDIYNLAKTKRYVLTEQMDWPGETDCNPFVRASIKATLIYMGAAQYAV